MTTCRQSIGFGREGQSIARSDARWRDHVSSGTLSSVESPFYLDAIFGALQRFGEQRKASSQWLSCAQRTGEPRWRLAFLRAGRGSHEAARRSLDEVASGLVPFARRTTIDASAEPLAPLETLANRLSHLRAELDSEGRRLGGLELELAENTEVRGSA